MCLAAEWGWCTWETFLQGLHKDETKWLVGSFEATTDALSMAVLAMGAAGCKGSRA